MELTNKDKAIMSHVLMYTICYDIEKKTPKVDKWMKQIRLKFTNSKTGEYIDFISKIVHESWENARKKVIEKDGRVEIKISELLMTIYNKIQPEYQNIYYTDRTFTQVVNSFGSCHTNRADEFHYTVDARKLADAWLSEIGVEVSNPILARMKRLKEQNILIDGKVA